jgi:nitrile hydratase
MMASEIAEPGLCVAAANARRLRPLNAVFVVACALLPFAVNAAERDSSPIYGVRILAWYRQWEMISPSHEAGGFSELRGILGNAIAVQAYRDGTLPFPDGAMMAKLAWTLEPSAGFPGAFVPGHATTVQIMVKDSTKYAATGSWGFVRFIGGGGGGPGPARDVLRLPSGERQRSRLRLHAVRAMNSGSAVPALGEAPIFRPGEKVRVVTRFPLGHYRVPLYLRGKTGVVERLVQPAVDNEEEGFGRNAGMKRHYYRIGVPMTEIWSDYGGSRRDSLYIEVFETWLETTEHG